MWNATYPRGVWQPDRQRYVLYGRFLVPAIDRVCREGSLFSAAEARRGAFPATGLPFHDF